MAIPNLSKEKIEELISKLSAADRQKLETVLKDPKLTEKLISTPQAQSLYKKLSGEK